jgi:GAF domain-containing protein
MEIQAILDQLLADAGASRVTLRQEVAGQVFPVTSEALAPGTPSIRDVVTPNMPEQPVVLRVLAGEQVVQDDSAAAFPGDEPFHAMRALYGGMQAQIVTPVVRGERTVAIVSVHELRRTRAWTDHEVALCRAAAHRIGNVLAEQG